MADSANTTTATPAERPDPALSPTLHEIADSLVIAKINAHALYLACGSEEIESELSAALTHLANGVTDSIERIANALQAAADREAALATGTRSAGQSPT